MTLSVYIYIYTQKEREREREREREMYVCVYIYIYIHIIYIYIERERDISLSLSIYIYIYIYYISLYIIRRPRRRGARRRRAFGCGQNGATGAGITAAADTTLGLQSILVKGFYFYSVNANGAAAKVMTLDRLGKKVRPGTLGKIKVG